MKLGVSWRMSFFYSIRRSRTLLFTTTSFNFTKDTGVTPFNPTTVFLKAPMYHRKTGHTNRSTFFINVYRFSETLQVVDNYGRKHLVERLGC